MLGSRHDADHGLVRNVLYRRPHDWMEPLMAPFDPDFDADNPYLDVPERFVAESDPEFDWDFGVFAEATYDPDAEAYYADAFHAQWE